MNSEYLLISYFRNKFRSNSELIANASDEDSYTSVQLAKADNRAIENTFRDFEIPLER